MGVERSVGVDVPLFIILTMGAVVEFMCAAAQAQRVLQYYRIAD
jgi:hypothetical protein